MSFFAKYGGNTLYTVTGDHGFCLNCCSLLELVILKRFAEAEPESLRADGMERACVDLAGVNQSPAGISYTLTLVSLLPPHGPIAETSTVAVL